MSTKQYAGTDLAEIREALREEGFTEVHQDNGARGFDLWQPYDDLAAHECVHVVVWPRADGGYWAEEY